MRRNYWWPAAILAVLAAFAYFYLHRRQIVLGAAIGKLFHAGGELRTNRAGRVQLVGGVDVKSTERFDWSPAVSVRTGLEMIRSGPGGPGRFVSLLLELYTGPSPYGQFFQDAIWWSFPLGTITSAILTGLYYKFGDWRKSRMLEPVKPAGASPLDGGHPSGVDEVEGAMIG